MMGESWGKFTFGFNPSTFRILVPTASLLDSFLDMFVAKLKHDFYGFLVNSVFILNCIARFHNIPILCCHVWHTYVCIGLRDPPQDLQPVSTDQPADSTLPVVEDENPLSGKDNVMLVTYMHNHVKCFDYNVTFDWKCPFVIRKATQHCNCYYLCVCLQIIILSRLWGRHLKMYY